MAHVTVTNTGDRASSEVAQAYVRYPAADKEPPLQLRAFAKVTLKAGESKRVDLRFDDRSLAHWNVSGHRWTTTPGDYQILVGTSSANLPLKAGTTVG